MPKAPLPYNEIQRLQALKDYDILDTSDEKSYDEITLLASAICDVPMATISLVDAERQWFKSTVGVDDKQTHRNDAFCAHTILQPNEPLIVHDALEDDRFKDSKLVLGGPKIRFYAGIPISIANHCVGALCAIDTKPRNLTLNQIEALKILAQNVVTLLELKRSNKQKTELIKRFSNSNTNLNLFVTQIASDFLAPIDNLESLINEIFQKRQDQDNSEFDTLHNNATKTINTLRTLGSSLSRFTDLKITESEFTYTNLNTILNDTLSTLNDLMEQKNMSVTADSLPNAIVNPVQLMLLFQNIIINALTYNNSPAPALHISASQNDETLTLSFKDNGIGMNKELQEHIFELFVRGDQSSNKPSQGLGLTICKEIAEYHSGSLSCQSEPGKGSTFLLTLPLPTESKV